MTERFWLGMGVVFISGIFGGGFALPMKYMRRWRWENSWLVFSLVGVFVLPWLMAYRFVPHLTEVYQSVPARVLLLGLLFGLLWGFAQTTYGLSIKAVGMAVAVSVCSGLTCLSGALVPLLVLNPADLFRVRGVLLLCSMPIVILGLAIFGVAGRRREKEQQTGDEPGSAKTSFKTGLALCVFTGLIGSSLNLGFAFSGDIIRKSAQLGAGPATSSYAVFSLMLSAGCLPSLFYCVYLLFRHGTFKLFIQEGWLRETLLALAMAVLWIAGVLLYGAGATLVGVYGTSVGFTLYIALSVLSSTVLGMLTGEWKSTSSRTRKLLALGLAALLISVVVLNMGGLF